MTLYRRLALLVVGVSMSSLPAVAQAQGMGMGGKHEETASEAELYDDPTTYALHGDNPDSDPATPSLYQDANLEGSTDCALVIATRIDKPSGNAFLWTPNPQSHENCDPPFNRWFVIEGNPDIGSAVHGRIHFWGLYKPVADLYTEGEGVDVTVSIGPYRIAYPTVNAIDGAVHIVDDSNPEPNVRIVTLEGANALADICAWPETKGMGKQTCDPVGHGTIDLPMKVKFTRIPPPMTGTIRVTRG